MLNQAGRCGQNVVGTLGAKYQIINRFGVDLVFREQLFGSGNGHVGSGFVGGNHMPLGDAQFLHDFLLGPFRKFLREIGIGQHFFRQAVGQGLYVGFHCH